MERRDLAGPGDELIRGAVHRRDDDGDLVAGIDLALDVTRDVLDMRDVGDGSPAEFHHQPGHGKSLIDKGIAGRVDTP